MKYSIIPLLALASSVLAAPQPHAHEHHVHKRDPAVVYVTQTQVAYVDGNGNPITSTSAETQTQQEQTESAAPVDKKVTTLSSSSSQAQASSATTASSSQGGDDSSSSASQTSSQSSATSSSGNGGSGGISGDLSAFSDPTEEFEDGKYSCDSLPTGQGVIALDWLNFGGWASIMNMDGETSKSCQDGYYCSYACQAGMSKTQWPSNQPSDGKSIGGLLCKNGKLYKSNSDKKSLCEWGQKSANAVNKGKKSIALCRTDYPGSENMVVPTVIGAGESKPMSVVNEEGYYQWKGGSTSAQYYVNNAGISVEDGCVWGDASGTIGNWAPVVLGSGYSDGKTWLSIIPNPNNKNAPNYSIKIQAEDGATLNGDCSYINGKYSGGSGSESDGCTVSVTGGAANFVFY
ncbi:Septation protein [Wickerhamomyces ciferrii]|uniref:Septation protein n=1 Tax=Wickerhamomyces ciferrii (strain ATCC 14091 / BCRC 22168 / CBS 111 / JCM 3599 / NBRC 0793 / NRRL Y-1031 F-60-10) TaxID=1206466 RepID=K0KQ83_WICCF|nr:Septation protein [Wickerhamomyces ciferrii]CCH45206.1 Septation protein [Wickerhamomyces ciferrii]